MLRSLSNLWLVLFLLLSFHLLGQSSKQNNLNNPENALWVHMYYLQPETNNPSQTTKLFPQVKDKNQAIKLARQLKQVYDGQGLYIYLDNVPNDPNYIDSTSQKNIYYPFAKALPEVYLIKRYGQWVYSEQTVHSIPQLHQKVFPLGANFFVDLLPAVGQKSLFGIMLWQYIGMGILLCIVLLIRIILKRLVAPIVRKYMLKITPGHLADERLIKGISQNISNLILLQLLRIGIPALQLQPKVTSFLNTSIRILTTLFIILIALKIIDILMNFMRSASKRTKGKMDDQLVPLLDIGLKVIVIALGVLQIMSIFGTNITALLAGVSIGGLALALAAQDTVKNLFGSAMIFMDKPFRIGDYVLFGGIEGTVVEVGFRTTRVRTMDSSIISVPNGNIVNDSIENKGIRVYRIYNTVLGLTYDTPAQKIEPFIEALNQMLKQVEQVEFGTQLIYFTEFGPSSLNIVFRVRLHANTFEDELRIKQILNLNIMKIAEDMQVQFAFPSTSVYIEKMGKSPDLE